MLAKHLLQVVEVPVRSLLTTGLVVGLLASACSSQTGATASGGSAAAGASGTNGGAAAVAGATSSGTGGIGGVNTPGGGGATETTAGAGGSGGFAGGSTEGGTAGASAAGAATGGAMVSAMSSGCGMALPANVKLGDWTDMADPGNGNPPPIKAGNVDRGYWVHVPPNYDKNKPYKVIYQGAGCGVSYPNGSGKPNKSGTGNGFQALWPFQDVDMGEAIQVGVDYGYNPARPNCFDDQNTMSNDFTFFPILKSIIENTFCVEPSQVYLSGHSSGSWWVNQMTCAFGNEIRGMAIATGDEPPLPACVSGAHIASLFLHDVNDQLNSYKGVLPACARALKNNGCATTTCDPSDTATTAPWPAPQGLTIPGNGKCIQFNGCPIDSPVVFCTTTNADPQGQDHYERVNSFIAPLFWDLFRRY